jgi:hypothetical protein
MLVTHAVEPPLREKILVFEVRKKFEMGKESITRLKLLAVQANTVPPKAVQRLH